jgi:hypothetical protein
LLLSCSLAALGLAVPALRVGPEFPASAGRYQEAGHPGRSAASVGQAGATPTGRYLPALLRNAAWGIHGRVTSVGTTLPLPDVTIVAYTSVDGIWREINSTKTASDGTYRLVVPRGSYRLAYFDNSHTYQAQYFRDRANLETADPVRENPFAPIDVQLIPVAKPWLEVEPAGGATGVVVFPGESDGVPAICKSRATPQPLVVVRLRAGCPGGTIQPSNVHLQVLGTPIPLASVVSDGRTVFSARLRLDELGEGEVMGSWRCGATATPRLVGRMIVCDPRGHISVEKINPPGIQSVNALVQIRQAPSAFQPNDEDGTSCRTTNERLATSTATSTKEWLDWSGEATPTLPFGSAPMGNTTPSTHSQTTTNGSYAWDVEDGCYYVLVDPQGSELPTRVSPLVGVITDQPVTDLNLHYTTPSP